MRNNGKHSKTGAIISELQHRNRITNERMNKALDVAYRYSQIGGEHHKAWTIDQMVRAMLGSDEAYERWIAEYKNGDEYSWDVGIAP